MRIQFRNLMLFFTALVFGSAILTSAGQAKDNLLTHEVRNIVKDYAGDDQRQQILMSHVDELGALSSDQCSILSGLADCVANKSKANLLLKHLGFIMYSDRTLSDDEYAVWMDVYETRAALTTDQINEKLSGFHQGLNTP